VMDTTSPALVLVAGRRMVEPFTDTPPRAIHRWTRARVGASVPARCR
jgi:hypothetical protein